MRWWRQSRLLSHRQCQRGPRHDVQLLRRAECRHSDGHGHRTGAAMKALVCRWFRPWRRDERGSVAVEFSFVGPIIVLLALGVTEWGRYMYVYNTMQFGCEQAARWGVFHI